MYVSASYEYPFHDKLWGDLKDRLITLMPILSSSQIARIIHAYAVRQSKLPLGNINSDDKKQIVMLVQHFKKQKLIASLSDHAKFIFSFSKLGIEGENIEKLLRDVWIREGIETLFEEADILGIPLHSTVSSSLSFFTGEAEAAEKQQELIKNICMLLSGFCTLGWNSEASYLFSLTLSSILIPALESQADALVERLDKLGNAKNVLDFNERSDGDSTNQKNVPFTSMMQVASMFDALVALPLENKLQHPRLMQNTTEFARTLGRLISTSIPFSSAELQSPAMHAQISSLSRLASSAGPLLEDDVPLDYLLHAVACPRQYFHGRSQKDYAWSPKLKSSVVNTSSHQSEFSRFSTLNDSLTSATRTLNCSSLIPTSPVSSLASFANAEREVRASKVVDLRWDLPSLSLTLRNCAILGVRNRYLTMRYLSAVRASIHTLHGNLPLISNVLATLITLGAFNRTIMQRLLAAAEETLNRRAPTALEPVIQFAEVMAENPYQSEAVLAAIRRRFRRLSVSWFASQLPPVSSGEWFAQSALKTALLSTSTTQNEDTEESGSIHPNISDEKGSNLPQCSYQNTSLSTSFPHLLIPVQPISEKFFPVASHLNPKFNDAPWSLQLHQNLMLPNTEESCEIAHQALTCPELLSSSLSLVSPANASSIVPWRPIEFFHRERDSIDLFARTVAVSSRIFPFAPPFSPDGAALRAGRLALEGGLTVEEGSQLLSGFARIHQLSPLGALGLDGASKIGQFLMRQILEQNKLNTGARMRAAATLLRASETSAEIGGTLVSLSVSDKDQILSSICNNVIPHLFESENSDEPPLLSMCKLLPYLVGDSAACIFSKIAEEIGRGKISSMALAHITKNFVLMHPMLNENEFIAAEKKNDPIWMEGWDSTFQSLIPLLHRLRFSLPASSLVSIAVSLSELSLHGVISDEAVILKRDLIKRLTHAPLPGSKASNSFKRRSIRPMLRFASHEVIAHAAFITGITKGEESKNRYIRCMWNAALLPWKEGWDQISRGIAPSVDLTAVWDGTKLTDDLKIIQEHRQKHLEHTRMWSEEDAKNLRVLYYLGISKHWGDLESLLLKEICSRSLI